MSAHRHPLGRIVATPAALHLLDRAGTSSAELLSRHAKGDWGEVGESGRKANEETIESAWGTVLSVYHIPAGTVWLATSLAGPETYTTFLLPDEW